MKNIFSKSDKQPPSKAKSFPKAVRELAEKDSQAKLLIYEKMGVRTRYLNELPLGEVVDISDQIQSRLSDQFGGGEFQLSLVNWDSEVVGKYSYSIVGQPKGRRSSEGVKGERKRGSPAEDALFRMGDKLSDAVMTQKTSAGQQLKESLELVREIRSDDGGLSGILKDLAGAAISNLLTPRDNMNLDSVVAFLELAQRIQPSLQQEDPMNTLIASLAPMLTQLMAGRSGQTSQLSPAQQQQLQAYLQQLQSTAAPHPQAPGEPAPSLASLGTAQPQATPAMGQVQPSVEQAAPAQEPPDQAANIIDTFLIPRLRQKIRENTSPAQLAQEIFKLIETAAIWDPDHPLFKELVSESDPQKLNSAIDNFLSLIPEFIENPELTANVKAELIQIAIGIFGMSQAEEEAVTDDSEPQPLDNISGPEST